MDEEMEDIVDGRFIALIDCDYIDFGYEYDASRYFDFTREETAAEARVAELWFETAQSYPPSRMCRSSISFAFLYMFSQSSLLAPMIFRAFLLLDWFDPSMHAEETRG